MESEVVLFKAKYEYDPENADELSFQKGIKTLKFDY